MKNFDVNLLRVLAVLLEERSVKAAAARLYLSQSAVSKQLAKLREAFDDPLFERLSKGLQPTPKALALAPDIYAILGQIDKLTLPTEFEPEKSRRTFNFDLVETAYTMAYLRFLPHLLQQAPRISINSQTWSDETHHRLIRREIDFAIGIYEWDERARSHYQDIPEELNFAELVRDHSVCMMRKDHPALQEEWNMDTFLRYRHLEVTIGGINGWLLKEVLELEKLQIDSAVNMTDLHSAIQLCQQTDLLMCYPSAAVAGLIENTDLVVKPIPIALEPGGYLLLWHRYFDNDLSHKWLRELIIAEITGLEVS